MHPDQLNPKSNDETEPGDSDEKAFARWFSAQVQRYRNDVRPHRITIETLFKWCYKAYIAGKNQ
jgi:hypothetical protein